MSTCMDPYIFGPPFWTVIHLICFNLGKDISDEKASDISKFIETLPGVLPCIDCAEHLKSNLVMLPFDKSDPFGWSVQLHNLVNSQLGKPTYDYKTAYEYWQAKCTSPKKHNTVIVIVILIIFFVCGMAFR